MVRCQRRIRGIRAAIGCGQWPTFSSEKEWTIKSGSKNDIVVDGRVLAMAVDVMNKADAGYIIVLPTGLPAVQP